MKVTEQGSYLIITSYPFKLAWLCLFTIFASLYAGIIQVIDQSLILLGVTLPTVFLFTFDFKFTIFDFHKKEMLQTCYSIKGKRTFILPFSSIFTVDNCATDTLRQVLGCVRVVTPDKGYTLTTLSDASANEQLLLIEQLKHSLHLK